MSITKETRWESYKKLSRNTMYDLIINVLESNIKSGLTAREVAIELYSQNYIKNKDRQATAPRLTELEKLGIVEVVGKRLDNISGINVAVYALKHDS